MGRLKQGADALMSYKCEMCDNWATRWALCDQCYAYMNHPSYQATLKEYKVHDETGTLGD